MSRQLKACNNCGSTSHLWAECDEKVDPDRKREHAKLAHIVSTKNNAQVKLDKCKSREEMKVQGQQINIPFALHMMDVKHSQLELISESFEDLGKLELDEYGMCHKKNDVINLKTILDQVKPDVSACIQNAKGRAKNWRSFFDDSPLCDYWIFTKKLEALIDLRDSLCRMICIAVRSINQCEEEAKVFIEHHEIFRKLELDIISGLESKQGLASVISTTTQKMKDLRQAASSMDADCKRIHKRRIECKIYEDILKTADVSILKFENKLLLLQVDSLKMDLESRNTLCRICYEREINTRLVTAEGNCTHCLCSFCLDKLDWNWEEWMIGLQQQCPFCREIILRDSCLKITLA